MPRLGSCTYWIALPAGVYSNSEVYHIMREAPLRPGRSAAEAVARLPKGLRHSCVLFQMRYFQIEQRPLTQKILDRAELFSQ